MNDKLNAVIDKSLWGKAVALIFLALAFILPSCNKYLDKKSNAVLAVPQSLGDLQKLLDDATVMNVGTPSFGETSADDYFLPDATIQSLYIGAPQYYTWQPFVYYGGDWQPPAPAIYNANLSLETLGNITVTSANQSQWNSIKGFALFYRSYYFLGLLWDYGKAWNEQSASTDLGIMLRTSPDFNVSFPRSSVKSCYQKIIGDTREAAALLPAYAQVATRPSKAAAFGLLARAYWSMRDYDSALQYADSALQINHQLMNYNNRQDVNAGAAAPFSVLNRETIFYSVMDNAFDLCYPYQALVDTALFSLYDNNDLRKQAYFMANGGYEQYKGGYVSDPVNNLFTGIATDEMYLIRAESYIRNNQVQKGLNDLDTLLATRYVQGTFTPLTGLSQQQALQLVLSERRKELIFRGLRWIDIKRQNTENANIVLKRVMGGQVYTLQPNAGYYALPLPTDLINIDRIQQN